MTNFKVGQKVVCIKKNAWKLISVSHPYTNINNPKHNETCTIKGFDDTFLVLAEYGDLNSYHPQHFKPLVEYTDATSEILSKFKPTEDTPDVEIKKHELTT